MNPNKDLAIRYVVLVLGVLSVQCGCGSQCVVFSVISVSCLECMVSSI